MPHQLDVSRAAYRDILGLPQDVQRRVHRKIQALADDPRPDGVKKLCGSDKSYRVRVRAYRILYEADDEAYSVFILRVGHRSGIYG